MYEINPVYPRREEGGGDGRNSLSTPSIVIPVLAVEIASGTIEKERMITYVCMHVDKDEPCVTIFRIIIIDPE